MELLKHVGSKNYPYLVYLKGQFDNIKIGSVPKQEKPYALIEKVIQQSTELDTGAIGADVVGFYAPDFMFPVKGKGLHLHCVAEDQAFGGHVLDLKLREVEVRLEAITRFEMELPHHDDYKKLEMVTFQTGEHVPVFEDKVKVKTP